jgi:hypothetical protein
VRTDNTPSDRYSVMHQVQSSFCDRLQYCSRK